MCSWDFCHKSHGKFILSVYFIMLHMLSLSLKFMSWLMTKLTYCVKTFSILSSLDCVCLYVQLSYFWGLGIIRRSLLCRLPLSRGFVVTQQPDGCPSQRLAETGTCPVGLCIWARLFAELPSASVGVLMFGSCHTGRHCLQLHAWCVSEGRTDDWFSPEHWINCLTVALEDCLKCYILA